MTAAEKAYAKAEQMIAEAKESGADDLDFNQESTRALSQIPPVISELTALRHLSIYNTQVNDLSPIAGMVEIISLALTDTQVSDLTPLSKLVKITSLTLNDTLVSDLAPLAAMTEMTLLQFENTQVSDLAPLVRMRELSDLDLNNTQVSDLSPLAKMTDMKSLWLSGTLVNDLSPLAKMTKMDELEFADTRVGDLSALSEMKQIYTLWLNDTEVRDLRVLRNMCEPDQAPFTFELQFSNCAAARLDIRIDEIAEIVDSSERVHRLFNLLDSGWEPPALDIPEPDPLADIGLQGGKLEIALSKPSEAERDERLKQVLHERLKVRAEDVARLAGNEFYLLAAKARSLFGRLDKPFEELDMINIHLDGEELVALSARGADREDAAAYPQELADGLAEVVRDFPGLTLDNDDVELLEERKRKFADNPPSEADRAVHNRLSVAAAGDDDAIGEELRALEDRLTNIEGGLGEIAMQVGVNRSLVVKIGLLSLASIGGAKTLMDGIAMYPQVAEFAKINMALLMDVAATYGSGFMGWFTSAMADAPQIGRITKEQLAKRERDKK